MEQDIFTLPLRELTEKVPACADFLKSYGLVPTDPSLPLPEALGEELPEQLRDMGLTPRDIADLLAALLSSAEFEEAEVGSITVCGGRDKDGKPEGIELTVRAGEVVSLVGPTGSGKSQLLADIECAARGDTPTGRHVLFDGRELPDEQRIAVGNRLVAQLTQNMNFIIDCTVEEFLNMHAGCRTGREAGEMIRRCFETANALSGEPFEMGTKLTRLSGGQARALMIADAACISPSPILLIDEIENAGIDRLKAVEMLRGGDKIVLLATHDPLLALSASRRVVMGNGGIKAVMETDGAEKEVLRRLTETERIGAALRNRLRTGERIDRYEETV